MLVSDTGAGGFVGPSAAGQFMEMPVYRPDEGGDGEELLREIDQFEYGAVAQMVARWEGVASLGTVRFTWTGTAYMGALLVALWRRGGMVGREPKVREMALMVKVWFWIWRAWWVVFGEVVVVLEDVEKMTQV